MTEATEDEKFQQLVQKLEPQSRLLRAWKLKGGVSAQVTALEIERADGQTAKLLVRQHGAVDLQQNPHVAAHEFRLLQLLQSVGLAAPTPYSLDQSGEIFATPYIVVEYIEGETEFTPADLTDFTFQLAAYLSRLHTVDRLTVDLSFLPRQESVYSAIFRERPAKVDDSLDEGRIRETLASVCPLAQRNKSVLLHGDFWLGNILWKEGQLVAVVDWEDAKFGDPLADIANTRLELLWAVGIEGMSRFTQQYAALTTIDFTHLPYWDLCAALRPAFKIGEWAADDSAEKNMRDGHKWFVTQAYEKLSLA